MNLYTYTSLVTNFLKLFFVSIVFYQSKIKKKIFNFIHKKLNKPLYYLVFDKTTSLSSMINVFKLKKQKLKLQILIFLLVYLI